MLLLSRNSWPRFWWFTYALALSCGAYFWQQFRLGSSGLSAGEIALLAAELLVLGFILSTLFRRDAAMAAGGETAEAIRWCCLTAAALLLTLPYARPERVGAGDAQDYAENLADFIAQTHQGVFPVFVGQSRYAFNGAFNPLRTAPYFEYVGGGLSELTMGKIGPFGVQNLEIILSLLAAAFSSYLCLARLAPRRRWFSALLAGLYISSPGVLALGYSGDMIPSWLTLPYLPLYGILLIRLGGTRLTFRLLAALAAVMAALWTIHAPIAMWLSFLAIPIILARVLLEARDDPRRAFLITGAGLAVFGLLAGYEFVSVATLHLPGLRSSLPIYSVSSITAILRDGWQGLLVPVSANASSLLSDLQLSPALWLCILGGFLGWRAGGPGLRVILLIILALLLLLLPIPPIAHIWHALPSWVGQITDQWPMQRFVPILSALAPFALLLSCDRGWSHRPRAIAAAMGVLTLGALWSGFEARKFLQRGYRVAATPALTHRLLASQSTVLSVYSYAMLGALPRYFSYGPVKPDFQLHLLDAESLEIAASNPRALISGEAVSERSWTRSFTSVAGEFSLQPGLVLPAGRSYLFVFDFKGVPPPGTLVISGTDFLREYPLPDSGADRAFGAGGHHASTLGLHIPDEMGEQLITMRYVAAPGSALPPAFADLKIVSYLSANLPFRVVSLIPYRLRIRSPHAGWLETPRIFIPGYQATVGGKPVMPERSPDGLVMLRVPAGEADIEIRYEGGLLLRGAFWTSLLSGVAFVVAWLGQRRESGRRAARRWVGAAQEAGRRADQSLRRFAPPIALAGLYASVTILGYANLSRRREQSAQLGQRIFTIALPGAQPGETVELKKFEGGGAVDRLAATYLDESHVDLQVVQADGVRSSSGSVLVNFRALQKIECGELPNGVECLFFNNRLIWRSDDRRSSARGRSPGSEGKIGETAMTR